MIAFLAVTAALVAGINISFYLQTTSTQDEMLETIGEYDQVVSAQSASERPAITLAPWEDGASGEFTTRFFVVHCFDNGSVEVSNNEYISSIDDEAAKAYAAEALASGEEKGNYDDYRYLVTERDGYRAVVFVNTADAADFLESLLKTSLLIAAAALTVLFLLMTLLSRAAVRPFTQNAERQRRFITDASHELNTPIASISTSIDILEMEKGPDEWTRNVKSQTARLSRLVSDLLLLSKMDERAPSINKANFNLSEAAWAVVESFLPRANANELQLETFIEDEVFFLGDLEAMQRLLSILLDNALKYTEPGGSVVVGVRKARSQVVIEVRNTCDVARLGNLDRLFDRFYRPDEARAQSTGGSGIGLSIARSIAEAHRGHISASAPDAHTVSFTAVF